MSTRAAIARRLDRIALEQLRAAVARLAGQVDQLRIENSALRIELERADIAAESWRTDALSMQEELCSSRGGRPGVTIDGRLVVVQ